MTDSRQTYFTCYYGGSGYSSTTFLGALTASGASGTDEIKVYRAQSNNGDEASENIEDAVFRRSTMSGLLYDGDYTTAEAKYQLYDG